LSATAPMVYDGGRARAGSKAEHVRARGNDRCPFIGTHTLRVEAAGRTRGTRTTRRGTGDLLPVGGAGGVRRRGAAAQLARGAGF
jgi:hypothetical protein